MSVKFVSHKKEVLEMLDNRRSAALEAIGAQVAGYALMLAPHDTGRLRNSITWATQKREGEDFSYEDDEGNKFADKVGGGIAKDEVCVGTNVEYAAYMEFGTSRTDPHPYLRPAVTDHIDEYKRMAEKFFKG